MRSLIIAKTILAGAGAILVSGCLMSEEPILGQANGAATPMKPGAYIMCPLDETPDDDDCEKFTVSHDASGLYLFEKEDEKPSRFRFRKIARRGYAVQSIEDDDDGYMYYYGRRARKKFQLTMMMCPQLPAGLRDDLIASGDLSSEDEEFEMCVVNTLNGLMAAAKAYHRGEASIDEVDGETMTLEFTPDPNAAK